MKKAKIALASIALLGIAGSIVAFKAARTKTRPAYYTFQYNATAPNTFTRATAIVGGLQPTVYYTLLKHDPASIYASLVTSN